MPRNCGWCASGSRAEWERRITSGESITAIASTTPYSESAARRHLRLHLQPQLLSDLRGLEPSLQLTDFADRLLELAGHAASIRSYAQVTNNGKLALQAIEQERSLLVTLMVRLGLDSAEAAELHEEARALTRAVAAVVRSGTFPELGDELADRLATNGLDHLADSLRRVSREIGKEVLQ